MVSELSVAYRRWRFGTTDRRELVDAYRDFRFNPHHGSDGKFASASGGGLISPEQYQALVPVYTDVDPVILAGKTAAALNDGGSGTALIGAINYNEVEGSARLRQEVSNLVNGKPSEDKFHRRNAEVLTDAIAHSPIPAPPELWRGMSIPGSAEELAGRYPTGGHINFALTSFSSSKKAAIEYQGSHIPGAIDPAKNTAVMVHWATDKKAKALPTENLAEGLRHEHEWLTNGDFEITKSAVEGKQLHLEVKQRKVFDGK